jgi:hypothetical protein
MYFKLFLRLFFSVKFSPLVPLKDMWKNEISQKVISTVKNKFQTCKKLFEDQKTDG